MARGNGSGRGKGGKLGGKKLSNAALARTAPGLTIGKFGKLVDPEVPRVHHDPFAFDVETARSEAVADRIKEEMPKVEITSQPVDSSVEQGEIRQLIDVKRTKWRIVNNVERTADGIVERHVSVTYVSQNEGEDLFDALNQLGYVSVHADNVHVCENADGVKAIVEKKAHVAAKNLFEGKVYPCFGKTLPLSVIRDSTASMFGDCSSPLALCVMKVLIEERIDEFLEVFSRNLIPPLTNN